MASSSNIVISGGTSCPDPMTRADLLTLRSSGGLSKDCSYVITDHVQGRLVAGTTIRLVAVSNNELSNNVSVHTPYDNTAWSGLYDIDTGLVIELKDNLGNTVSGKDGTEVSSFDWGNPNITNSTIENSSLTLDIGSVAVINRLIVTNNSSLDLTGFTGQIIQTEVISSTLILNSNVTIQYVELNNTARIQINAGVLPGIIQRSNFHHCVVTANSGTTINIFSSQILSESNISISGTTQLSLTDSVIKAASSIASSEDSIITINNTEFNGQSVLMCEATSNITLGGCYLISGSSIFTYDSIIIDISNTLISNQTTLELDSMEDTNQHYISCCEFTNNSTIYLYTADSMLNYNISRTTITNYSSIELNNIDALFFDRVRLDNSSQINVDACVVTLAGGPRLSIYNVILGGNSSINIGEVDIGTSYMTISNINIFGYNSAIVISDGIKSNFQLKEIYINASNITLNSSTTDVQNVFMNKGRFTHNGSGVINNLNISNNGNITTSFDITNSYYNHPSTITTTGVNTNSGRDFFNNNWV